jgi:hypothetical protein
MDESRDPNIFDVESEQLERLAERGAGEQDATSRL